MKTYQKPTTDITVLETINMIAASQLKDIVDNGQDLGDAPTTEQTSGNLSRLRIVWG